MDFALAFIWQVQKTDEERRQLKVRKKSVFAYKSVFLRPHSSSVTAEAWESLGTILLVQAGLQ